MVRYLTREEQAKVKAGIPLRLPNEKPRKQKRRGFAGKKNKRRIHFVSVPCGGKTR